MALATSTMIGLGLAAAAAGGSYYNTQNTAKKQDRAAAENIRNLGTKHRQADKRITEEVDKLKTSTADESRRKGLDSYMDALRKNKGTMTAGLTPTIGGERFQADSATAAQGVQDYGAASAGMLAAMDAPLQQRQQEAFGYGNLATDVNMIAREASGQDFLDKLRMSAIRRNAGLDAATSFMGGAAGAIGTGGGGGGGGMSGYTAPSGMQYNVPVTRSGAGWHNAYGANR